MTLGLKDDYEIGRSKLANFFRSAVLWPERTQPEATGGEDSGGVGILLLYEFTQLLEESQSINLLVSPQRIGFERHG
jgi:hypothetical protein